MDNKENSKKNDLISSLKGVWEDNSTACILLLMITLVMVVVWGHGFIW